MSVANAVDLLNTKIAVPRLRSPLVPRENLLARLDRGLDGRLTVISAPAGFGKTTLVGAWIAAHPDVPTAWVSLDEGDDDPVRFWRYIITACAHFAPDLGAQTLNMLAMPQQPPFEAALTLWINELTYIGGRCVLVLEDYHAVSAPRIHETLAFLLDHLPAALHVIITPRAEPPLPLARLRMRGELCELDAADLRFTEAESETFLRGFIPFPISAQTVARLDAHTEG